MTAFAEVSRIGELSFLLNHEFRKILKRNFSSCALQEKDSFLLAFVNGIIGRKIGMAQTFGKNGEVLPVTYLRCEPNTVHDLKTLDRDGYESVVLAFEDLGKKATKNKKYRVIKEFPGHPAGVEKGVEVNVGVFEPEEKITIVGISKGKGFQGRVRRHNCHVARRTHGTKYGRHGSSGSIAITARSQPGIKMPGRMGSDQITLHKREVVVVDKERNLIAVKGPVPGAVNSLVYLKKSVS